MLKHAKKRPRALAPDREFAAPQGRAPGIRGAERSGSDASPDGRIGPTAFTTAAREATPASLGLAQLQAVGTPRIPALLSLSNMRDTRTRFQRRLASAVVGNSNHARLAKALPRWYPNHPYKQAILQDLFVPENWPALFSQAPVWLPDYPLNELKERLRERKLMCAFAARNWGYNARNTASGPPLASALGLLDTYDQWHSIRPAADLLIARLLLWISFRLPVKKSTPRALRARLENLPFSAEEWLRASEAPDFPLRVFIRHPPPGIPAEVVDSWRLALL